MEILNVKGSEFKEYGRILTDIDTEEIIRAMALTEITNEVVYVASDKNLEGTSFLNDMYNKVFGQADVQIGYCNGNNNKLNALEYHKSSEVNVAATDMILLLGRLAELNDDNTFDTSKVKAFLIPKGTAVELYSTTLHYAPCNAPSSGANADNRNADNGNAKANETGFKCVVVLPKGTNEMLIDNEIVKQDELLFANNKWLIAHKDANIEGAFVGLVGENIAI